MARHGDGSLRIDQVAPGRGAWLCLDPDAGVPAAGCLEQAVKRQAFSRAFKVKVEVAAATTLRDSAEERARMVRGGRRDGDRPQKGLT